MINAPQLLADLTRLLKKLEDDLRQRIGDVPALRASLNAEWQSARDANRTAETFESWSDQVITQAGVHWLLSCVFIRFIEDNELVDRPWLGGTPESGRLALARDRHEAYFRSHPVESDRDYLLASFKEAGALPGLKTFFDEAHNPVFRLGVSGDAAMALRRFWQQVDPNTGHLVHDFTDPDWNTRFLGDLYQDLSEATRKRYALLQTPEFVEEFILDRTLTPAIREFGFREVRMIDPTCGSGHFLLGGFHRLAEEWARAEPGRNRRDIAQKALDAVAGVDLNPFAVAIARFRLLLAALKVGEVRRLADAPNYKLNIAIGDSLLHGKRFGLTTTDGMFEDAEHYAATGLSHAYASEDLDEVNRILGCQYHTVVGNPPYIVVKDPALNSVYRQRYASCHRQYSLGVPFTERFFDLAVTGGATEAGFVGLITANSFMKREFGRNLIEKVLPQLDLSHVIDTSGAYIPGHGTPTVILLGRHRRPIGGDVRSVMGIKGEPTPPEDPGSGCVWSSIVRQIDLPGSESEFVSVCDTPRSNLAGHPWSMGGGGLGELKELIERGRATLSSITTDIGFVCITKADDAFVMPRSAAARHGCSSDVVRPFGIGEDVRDWLIAESNVCLFPYDQCANLRTESELRDLLRVLWPCRTSLYDRKVFGGKTYREAGKAWFSYGQIPVERFRIKPAIAFAFVATHNHFSFDRGGRVFKQSAPVIKLHEGSDELDHLRLLGVLNSSLVCFWLKQVSFNKGDSTDAQGARTTGDSAFDTYEFSSTKVAEIPLPEELPTELSQAIDVAATSLAKTLPTALIARLEIKNVEAISKQDMADARIRYDELSGQLIALQEELDWFIYLSYGVVDEKTKARIVSSCAPPCVRAGERAFEIVLARSMLAGELQSAWFERNEISPVSEIPAHWPEEYRKIVQARIDLIENDRNIGILEKADYKRRWNSPAWDELERSALRDWLLNRLEAPHLWSARDDNPPQLTTVNRLADAVRSDAAFMQIAELYAGHSGFDVAQIVADLVTGESVPFLPVLRYADTGLRKRAQWEDTWALQRREDTGENVGKIPVPPKYQSKDFLKADFWRLRGGLDVPKERWVSYPGCERGTDTSLVIAWAGWDHLQQATALAAYYLDMKDNEGWPAERLQPLLAGLLELIPWLMQWHNDVHPVFGERMGDYYEGFLNDQARELGCTVVDLRNWKPAVTATRRGRRPRATTSNT